MMGNSNLAGDFITKDSEPDNKKTRMEKCNYQTLITAENQNQNRNAKKHSIKDWEKISSKKPCT